MPSEFFTDMEKQDAELVDRATQTMAAGDLAAAETLLLGVVGNTPAEYVNSTEHADGSIAIKFWSHQEFIHYVMWEKQQGRNRGIASMSNAYPRAYYYLGFICVKTRRFTQALEYLERGHQLEPANPKFNFEKAQALMRLGEQPKALALYAAVREAGPHVSTRDLAIARRGRGFVLIEMGRLDEAEAAFKSSLEIEPGNPNALNELRYIDHLRKGGRPSAVQSVASTGPNLLQCSVCGETIKEKGMIVNVRGTPTSVCEKCQQKLTTK